MMQWIQKERLVWGPVFLFLSLFCGTRAFLSFDLLVLGCLGYFLSAKMYIRGFTYSLILVSFFALFKHLFFVEDHLWQFGIEASLALGFLITALAFEEKEQGMRTLGAQIETSKANLANLEEENALHQKTTQEQQMIFQEKLTAVQKEIDEIQTEYASILILNEVLRKTTAKQIQEKEEAQKASCEAQFAITQLKMEVELHEKEMAHLKNSDLVAIENRQLMKELNQARFNQEQTHLINETLARLHLREALKANEANQEVQDLKDQLRASRKIEPVNEKLQFAEEKMLHLSQIEPLFQQLKKQFEEKNQILHETRSQLFHKDTELQRISIEKNSLEFAPLPKEVVEELELLTQQVEALEEENHELQELITALSQSSERKKKVKTKSVSVDQSFLF